MPLNLINSISAAGAAHTNSTTEAAIASWTIPGYFFQAGRIIVVEGYCRATATNSTDTLTTRLVVGASTLAGTAIATSAAVDVANDDICAFRTIMHARDVDSSGTIVTQTIMNNPDATGQATRSFAVAVASLDMTAALLFEVGADWSVADAGNSVQMEQFLVYEIKA